MCVCTYRCKCSHMCTNRHMYTERESARRRRRERERERERECVCVTEYKSPISCNNSESQRCALVFFSKVSMNPSQGGKESIVLSPNTKHNTLASGIKQVSTMQTVPSQRCITCLPLFKAKTPLIPEWPIRSCRASHIHT